MKRHSSRLIVLALIVISLLVSSKCATKGLITQTYPDDFYRIPKFIPHDTPINHNPTFIIYGDTQLGWRVHEKFWKKKNWFTWKMLLFPFYEIYWLGNGIIGSINWLRSVPDYGIRELRMVRDAIYEEAKRSKVDFILNTGDLVSDGRRPKHWETFLKVNKEEVPLLTEIPFLPNMGNHDRVNDSKYGLPNYEAVFDYPQFYVLEFPDLAIFVVNSQIIIDSYQKIDDDQQDELFKRWFVSDEYSERSAWLQRELASRKTKFKIVVMHHPPISFGKQHKNWLNPLNGRSLRKKRRMLFQVFQQNQVQVVFSGHEHLYEHSILHKDPSANDKNNQIHIIVTGSGGAPLRDLRDEATIAKYKENFNIENLAVESIKRYKIYSYCLISCDSAKLQINVFEVTGDAMHPIRLVDEFAVNQD